MSYVRASIAQIKFGTSIDLCHILLPIVMKQIKNTFSYVDRKYFDFFG